jgi:fatty acid desaturase
MFLNNNLHALHPAEPGLAWYKLPARYRERRAELLKNNGGYRYGGYLEIAARYLVRPKEHPRHPLATAGHSAATGALT